MGLAVGIAFLWACRADGPAQPDSPTGKAAPAAVAADSMDEATPPAEQTPSSSVSSSATLAQAAVDPEPEAVDVDASAGEPEPAPPEEEADAGPRKVLILGDSLAATGFGALLERRLDAHPDVVCYRRGKSASGLARPDFFDWFREGKKQVEFREPDLVVVIMGGNDGQDLTRRRRGGKRVNWKNEAWPAEYRARVDAFLTTVAAPERKVLWLGLPTMGLRSLERKLELIREIQKEAVEAAGGTYLDTAPFVTDAQGELLKQARVDGKQRKIRAEDRIHFTMSGSEYFADRVYPEILGVLELAEAPPSKP